MYVLLIGALLGAGLLLWRAGVARQRRYLVWSGAGVVVATVAGFALLDLWAEGLWFEAVGYAGRFWTFVGAKVAVCLAGATGAAALAALLNLP